MKTLVVLLSIAIIPVTATMSSAFDVGLQTGFNFDWWSDSKDDSAHQVYTPFRLDGRYEDFSFTVLSGYAYTHVSPSVGEDQSLSHVLDTKLNLSYQIAGKLPVDVLIGLDFNLPTGKTNFKERQLSLIMDPDLISINNFGEGFNVNPTLTIAKEWGPWVFGIGAGYSWRGEYNFTTTLQDYNPGDILNLTAEARYQFSQNWRARLFGNYAAFGKDKLHEGDFYKEGNFLLLGGGLDYSQPKWDSGFLFRGIFRGKSEFQVLRGELATEDHNVHGDEYRGDLYLRYFLNDKTTLKSYLQGLFITRNGYSPEPPVFLNEINRFVGQREKLSLGLGASRVLMPHLEAEFYVKGFVMHDEHAFFPEVRDSRTYGGFSVGIQVAGRF
jgi:hypothetical protein